MKFELIDYQRDAAAEVLKRLTRARDDWRNHDSRSAFALSAMTGSGKTVIATAVIEALLFGSADLEVEADPRATFLWVTDDPALNRQTRNKMMAASDLLSGHQLEILSDKSFEPTLLPGRVYFLNIQQLGKNAGFANVAGDSFRNKTGWQIIGDTIRSEAVDLYVVVDEAHRGMKATKERASNRPADHRRTQQCQPTDAGCVGDLSHHRAIPYGDGRGRCAHRLRTGRCRDRSGARFRVGEGPD